MANGFLISDIHLGVHTMSEDKWIKIADEYFNEFFIPEVKKRWNKGDKIFILGDLFDNRNYLTLRIISFALDLFNKLEKEGFDILILGGNHDYRNNSDSEHTSLRILERYPNIQIVKDTISYNFSDKNILIMPWVGNHKTEHEILKKWAGKVDYLFCHSELRGAKTNMRTVLTHGLTVADYVAYPRVYSGHIHIYQKLDNFKFLGSPFHLDRNDKGNKKGLTIINFDNDTEEFIENNISPEYKTIEIKKESDLEKLDRLIKIDNLLDDKDNFIDIVINNSVLLNSKEAKRKIEEVAKKKNISSVKYVDDTTVDDGIVDINLDDIGLSVSTEDLIREYVKNQQVESALKDRYMKILEDSIKLCKNTDED
jgi:DNA repair exonuclease SbcCD nuclease subunit